MKILAFADTHGDKKAIKRLFEKAKNVDLLICAGDISNFGNNLRKIVADFKKLKKTMLIIHGNHESREQIQELADEFPWLLFIHKGSYKLENYRFFGYGGGGFSREDPGFERLFNKFMKTVKKGEKVVLITHGPPYGNKVDYIPYHGHTGCKTYTKLDEKFKPIVHICGHLHETDSMRDKVGNTLVINPGAEGKILRI